MAKQAYELTQNEVALVQGFRQGQLILPSGETWLRLTNKEVAAILLCRKVQHGPVTFLLKNGQPTEAQAEVHIRLGQDGERADLVRVLREP